MSTQPLEARLAHLEGAFLQVDRRLESFERMVASRFDQQDSRFNQMESRFNQIESRFTVVDQRFNWLIGIVITSWMTLILTIIFHR